MKEHHRKQIDSIYDILNNVKIMKYMLKVNTNDVDDTSIIKIFLKSLKDSECIEMKIDDNTVIVEHCCYVYQQRITARRQNKNHYFIKIERILKCPKCKYDNCSRKDEDVEVLERDSDKTVVQLLHLCECSKCNYKWRE